MWRKWRGPAGIEPATPGLEGALSEQPLNMGLEGALSNDSVSVITRRLSKRRLLIVRPVRMRASFSRLAPPPG